MAVSCVELRHLHKKPPRPLVGLPERGLVAAVRDSLNERLVFWFCYLRASALQEASAGVSQVSLVACDVLSIQILDNVHRQTLMWLLICV